MTPDGCTAVAPASTKKHRCQGNGRLLQGWHPSAGTLVPVGTPVWSVMGSLSLSLCFLFLTTSLCVSDSVCLSSLPLSFWLSPSFTLSGSHIRSLCLCLSLSLCVSLSVSVCLSVSLCLSLFLFYFCKPICFSSYYLVFIISFSRWLSLSLSHTLSRSGSHTLSPPKNKQKTKTKNNNKKQQQQQPDMVPNVHRNHKAY